MSSLRDSHMRHVLTPDGEYWTDDFGYESVAIDAQGPRDLLVRAWRRSSEEWDRGDHPNKLAWMVRMRCGHYTIWVDELDIPRESVHCYCGRPNCWIVKYSPYLWPC
jgi:hypothetical protein